MHDGARQFVERYVTGGSVLEIGSRDINGGVRDLFGESYLGVDIAPGPGVDIVTDAAQWLPTGFDVVVCCEVAEHTAEWPKIIAKAIDALNPGGRLILTMAGDGRGPHSAVDGGEIRPGEHYANIGEDELSEAIIAAGATSVVTDTTNPGDLYAVATKAR